MNPKRKRRLLLVGLLLLGVSAAVALTLTALKENVSLFITPADIAAGRIPQGNQFRVGGIVVANSVKRDSDSLHIQFDVTDGAGTVRVDYTGILPDLFREGQGIVAQGSIENGIFKANEVLAKHDEKYMPPEVAEALKRANTPAPHPTGAQ